MKLVIKKVIVSNEKISPANITLISNSNSLSCMIGSLNVRPAREKATHIAERVTFGIFIKCIIVLFLLLARV